MTVQWETGGDDHDDRIDGIKNLKRRASREFYRGEEKISDEHRAYLKSLVRQYPFNNHIYGELLQ
jgi:hypothetical protein